MKKLSSSVVGKRSCRNTLTLFRDLCARSNGSNVPLIATDGFKFDRKIVQRLFGAACLYGQVIKRRRNNRVARVQRKAVLGGAWRWDELWRKTFRDIFLSLPRFLRLIKVNCILIPQATSTAQEDFVISMAA